MATNAKKEETEAFIDGLALGEAEAFANAIVIAAPRSVEDGSEPAAKCCGWAGNVECQKLIASANEVLCKGKSFVVCAQHCGTRRAGSL